MREVNFAISHLVCFSRFVSVRMTLLGVFSVIVFGVLGMGMSRVVMSVVLVMICGLISATASHQTMRVSIFSYV